MSEAYHQYLIQLINTSCFSRRDYISSLLWEQGTFRKNSVLVHKLWKRRTSVSKAGERDSIQLHIEPYTGENRYVLSLVSFLRTKLKDDLYGAYIQGSIATREEIRYSDMDAVVILKDEVVSDAQRLARVARKLYHAKAFFFKYDPLQHHGWFVLTEGMLQNYNEAYFPVELFRHSRSLLEDKAETLFIKRAPVSWDAYRKAFKSVAFSLIKRLEAKNYPSNCYVLKSVLSEFMLLPSLYFQASNYKAIYKKDSFDAIKNHFKPEHWAIMDQVSQIRRDWDYSLSPLQRRIFSTYAYPIRKTARRWAPSIPENMRKQLTPGFYTAMLGLIYKMVDKVDKAE
ncbi:MAG TPA: hypothetical protein DIU20_07685 [Cryomorphaceae bacterium]|nr:hypothetical protein [Cryomorphaceae bacterium]